MKKNNYWLRAGSVALALAMVAVWYAFSIAKNDEAENSRVQTPLHACSVKVPEPQPRDLSALAKVNAESALAAAKAAHPGTTATKIQLENENGCLLYSVHLNNGQEVIVDAGNGTVIHSQSVGSGDRDSDHEARESDD